MRIAGATDLEVKAAMRYYLAKNEPDVAEMRLIQFEQKKKLPKLYAALQNSKSLNKRVCSQRLLNCNPTLVDKTVRLNKRIEKAVVGYET